LNGKLFLAISGIFIYIPEYKTHKLLYPGEMKESQKRLTEKDAIFERRFYLSKGINANAFFIPFPDIADDLCFSMQAPGSKFNYDLRKDYSRARIDKQPNQWHCTG
jgi:hypothetical protein